jgi:hypothetical protein
MEHSLDSPVAARAYRASSPHVVNSVESLRPVGKSRVMAAKKKRTRRWTQHVTQTSNALDLERGVFAKNDPKSIARSLKQSAEESKRRKAEPFRSAMSMLNFYINRAGRNLPKERREKLEAAKDELRALYGRPRRRSEGKSAGRNT